MASKLHTAWGVRHRVSSLPSLETTGQNKYMGPYDAGTWTTVDGRRRTEAIGERRRASSSTVRRWEHKIEDVLVGRLHRSSISSQLVHSVLADVFVALSSIYPALQTYLWPRCDTLAVRLQLDPSEPRCPVCTLGRREGHGWEEQSILVMPALRLLKRLHPIMAGATHKKLCIGVYILAWEAHRRVRRNRYPQL